MRDLLFLCHRIPYPPDKGDKIRSWHFLRHLTNRFRVHLGCFIDDPADRIHTAVLRSLCRDTCFVSLTPAVARAASLRGFATGEPLTKPYFRSRRLATWTAELIARCQPGHIFVYSAAMAQYAERATWARRVIDFVDVDSEKWRAYAAAKPWPARAIYRCEADRLLAYERRIAAAFDAGVFVSAAEAALFRQLAPEVATRVTHIDNGVDCDYFTPRPAYPTPFADEAPTVVFTGAMNYWPNVDAVRFFAEAALPSVRRSLPRARFVIVGTSPTREVQALARLPGVIVTGRVPDVRPYLAHAHAVVVPLRIARGVQNKLLEAMAMAKPVVATSKALAGVGAAVGRQVLVADSGEDFARAVIALLNDGAGRDFGPAARRFMLDHFSWSAGLRRLDEIVEGTGEPTAPAAASAAKSLVATPLTDSSTGR